jgi:hypothetical protein
MILYQYNFAFSSCSNSSLCEGGNGDVFVINSFTSSPVVFACGKLIISKYMKCRLNFGFSKEEATWEM